MEIRSLSTDQLLDLASQELAMAQENELFAHINKTRTREKSMKSMAKITAERQTATYLLLSFMGRLESRAKIRCRPASLVGAAA